MKIPLLKSVKQSTLLAILFSNALITYADNANYKTVGTNTAEVVAAANAFTATLTSAQIGTSQTVCTMDASGTLSYAYDLALAECWSNLPGGRNGLQFSKLSETQLNAALALAKTALSPRGYTLLNEIRTADDLLGKSQSSYGGTKYSVAFYGTPSLTEPWMLQFGGHHLAYNITYNGKAVSATPLFSGTEPPNWTDSNGVKHAPLEIQRAAFEKLANALQADTTANASALLSTSFDDVLTGISNGCDSKYPISYPTTNRGVLVSSLTSPQKNLVKNTIAAWTALIPRAYSNVLSSAYTSDAALAVTYVAYSHGNSGITDFTANPSGQTTQHSYIRIDGPRVWIEFVVQQGFVYQGQVHYHTIWRDKEADYGGEFSSAATPTTGQCGSLTTSGGGPGA